MREPRRTTTIPQRSLDRAEAAYLAGLWDADGSITLGRTGKADARRFGLSAHIHLTNLNTSLLRFVQSQLGGSVLTNGKGRRNHPSAVTTYWRLHIRRRAHVEWALKQLLPFLRVKQERAEIVLAWLERTKSYETRSVGPSARERAEYNKAAFYLIQMLNEPEHKKQLRKKRDPTMV